jgi:hypothetical protein
MTPDRMFQQVMTLHDTLAQAAHSMLADAKRRIRETVGLAPVVPRVLPGRPRLNRAASSL